MNNKFNRLQPTTGFLIISVIFGLLTLHSFANCGSNSGYVAIMNTESGPIQSINQRGEIIISPNSIDPENSDDITSSAIETNDSDQKNNSIEVGIPVKVFKAALVDKDNNKWFLTESGVISFDGEKWILHNKNSKVKSHDLNGIAFEDNPHGQEIWMASPNGAIVAALPIDALSGATTYHSENTPIASNNVVRVAVGKSPLRWFGTDKGISAFKSDKWLTPDYADQYPDFLFQEYPILSMATDNDGDTLYVGTSGAGVARVFSNDVDAITGASVYAQWGPIVMPSDKVYSIYIASNDVKWFGTDMGVARHEGNETLENWTAFTTKEGLADNFVQAITADKSGNVWFGTKGGISVFNGSVWTSYTENDGLISNNVLCIVVDKTGVVWIGTDNGVSSFNDGRFTNYQ